MIISVLAWNMDGYSHSKRDFLVEYLKSHPADIVILTETTFMPENLERMECYRLIHNPHNPAKHHGVAILVGYNLQYQRLDISMDIRTIGGNLSDNPTQGRVTALRINDKFNFVGVYTPFSGTYKEEHREKSDYRIKEWDPAFHTLINDLNKQLPTLVIGDLNVAPSPMDIIPTWHTRRFGGYKPGERNNFQLLLKDGWVDTWRRDHPDTKDYTWIGHKNDKNAGMRLDHILASDSIASWVIHTEIIRQTVSDHRMIRCTINC